MTITCFPGWATSPEIFQQCLRLLPDIVASVVDFGYFGERIASESLHPDAVVPRVVDRPCVVVGVSMGALYALRAAALFPDKVRGILLVSGFPRFLEDAGYQAQPAAALESMRSQLSRKPSALLEGFYRSLAHPSKLRFKVPDGFNTARLDAGIETAWRA